MQYLKSTTLLRHLVVLFCVTLSFHSLQCLATPISSQSLSAADQHDTPLEPHSDIASTPAHPTTLDLLPKRAYTTYYNNLGVWRMVLTSAALLLGQSRSPLTNGNSPAHQIATFMTGIAAEAAKNFKNGEGERTIVEFGQGALSLAFMIRDGSTGQHTIPWALVVQLAEQFAKRAALGSPMAFRAQIYGPLGQNSVGLPVWMEVIMSVAGEVVMEGIPFSIY